MEILTIHAAFNPENHLFNTYWSYYWSLSSENIFQTVENNACSAEVGQHEKQ
jgi:hypothetical protein